MTKLRLLQLFSVIFVLTLAVACKRDGKESVVIDESWKPQLLTPAFDPNRDGFPQKFSDLHTDQQSNYQLLFTGSPDILQLSLAPHKQDSFAVLIDMLNEAKISKGKKLFASIAVQNPGKDKDSRGHVVASYYVYNADQKLIASAKATTVWRGSGLPENSWQFASQPLVFQIPSEGSSSSYTIVADVYDVKLSRLISLSKSVTPQ